MLILSALWLLVYASFAWTARAEPTRQAPLVPTDGDSRSVSFKLFAELEELARIVDIAYCVGTTGIQKPFLCASRCQDFTGFELVTTWNTGPLLSDSCGYIVLSHAPSPPRIIVAFRGTYSIANTIVDLSTIPQEYVPFPADEHHQCTNCTVHAGFFRSWRHTRPYVNGHVAKLVAKHPEYQVVLVGHSLGGAVAALAGLEFSTRGWKPQVTTFGEPRVGNEALMKFIDDRFQLGTGTADNSTFRRVTHVDDPVPLLPLGEWGYRMHAGEIYIAKPELYPAVSDLRHCEGDEDGRCIAAGEIGAIETAIRGDSGLAEEEGGRVVGSGSRGPLPARYGPRELFAAHRDYFWRLGLCIPGGDPRNWQHE